MDQNSKEFLLHYTQAKVGVSIILSSWGNGHQLPGLLLEMDLWSEPQLIALNPPTTSPCHLLPISTKGLIISREESFRMGSNGLTWNATLTSRPPFIHRPTLPSPSETIWFSRLLICMWGSPRPHAIPALSSVTLAGAILFPLCFGDQWHLPFSFFLYSLGLKYILNLSQLSSFLPSYKPSWMKPG